MADLDLEQFEALMQQEQQAKVADTAAAAAAAVKKDSKNVANSTGKPAGSSEVQAAPHQGGGSKDEASRRRPDNQHHREQRDVKKSRRSNDSDNESNGRKKRASKSSKRRSRSRSNDGHSDKSQGGGGRRPRHQRRRGGSSRSSSGDETARVEAKKAVALAKSLEDAKRQQEEAKRDDCTVLVTRIHLHSNEKDIYQFFTLAGVGKIRDIRIIRDQRSGKSKGIAYVEFYAPESVLMALAMSNQQIKGQTIMINASQAEKNRAAAANKYKKTDKTDMPSLGNTLAPRYQHAQREQNNRIYIGGLVDHLANITQTDIRQCFSSFGQIDAIELPKDPFTGKNRGHAIVEFSTHKEAKIAAQSMNGFELVKGSTLKVNILTDGPRNDPNGKEEELGEDTTNTYLHSAQDRTALMQKLSRNKDPMMQPGGPNGTGQAGEARPGEPGYQAPLRSSHCVMFTGMFDPTQVDLRKEPNFFMDVKDQVASVCAEHGRVERIYVEQKSDGVVWVQYRLEDLDGAIKVHSIYDGQLFDGNQIGVIFVSEADFNLKVKER